MNEALWHMVTIKDIAKRVGMDISTVSRALNDSSRVKPETRALINAVAKELNYSPDDLAQGLAGKNTNTIGVVVPEVRNIFYSEVIDAIEDRLISAGFSIILGQSKFNPQKESFYVDLFQRKRVSGIIIVSHVKPVKALSSKITGKVPVVLIDSYEKNEEYCSINIDNSYGVRVAIEYLIKSGHRKIGFIGDNVTTQERLNGYKAAFMNNNIDLDTKLIIVDENRFEEGGYKKMKALLSRKCNLTALFCVNDSIAIGAIKAICNAGLKVPDDISVIGFDDIPIASYLDIPLTTIKQPKGEMGDMAASIIMNMVRKKGGAFVQNIVLKPELIIRSTTTGL